LEVGELVNRITKKCQEQVPQMELGRDASARGSQEAWCCNQGMTYLLVEVEEIDRTVNSVNTVTRTYSFGFRVGVMC